MLQRNVVVLSSTDPVDEQLLRYVFAGRQIGTDISRLGNVMDVRITSDNKKELGRLCRDAGLIADGTESLPGLAANVLHRHLPKPTADRISPWANNPLSESQIAYAAADAAASLMVYEVAAGQPDLTIRCRASELRAEMKVDIVPSSSMQISAVMADASSRSAVTRSIRTHGRTR